MQAIRGFLFLLFGFAVFCGQLFSQPQYRDYRDLSGKLRDLRQENRSVMQLSALAQSRGERSVWLLEISSANREQRGKNPAVLIVAGIEGNDLAGTEMAVSIAEKLCTDEDQKSLIEHHTVYIIPRLNPDAAEAFFASPRTETVTNTTPFDADHDGLTDEDGADDLNGDGVISWMRIEDAGGKWIPHPDEPRIMIEADATKGETGKWLYQMEGKDDDGDEALNEDPSGGVNFNKNFPFEFPWFDEDAGVNPVYENETRALAQFVVDHPNIAVVLSYGSNSNLLKKPDGADRSEGRKPQTKIRNEDVTYYDFFGVQYREILGLEKTIDTPSIKGAFADWVYFHKGRLSLSTPVWHPEMIAAFKKPEEKQEEAEKDENADTAEEKKDEKKEEKKKDDRAKSDLEYLVWLQENAPDSFIEWQPVEHPDYPGKKAEVGGFAPYAKTLPPSSLLSDLAEKHSRFVMTILQNLPAIEIAESEVKPLGSDVFDLRLKVHNKGYLPTVMSHGVRTGEVFPTRVELELDDVTLLAGEKRIMLEALAGGEAVELRYTIKAKSGANILVRVTSALGGSVETTVTLATEGR